MKKLIVLGKSNNQVILHDIKYNTNYAIAITILDADISLDTDTMIELHENIFDPKNDKYCAELTFGDLNNPCGLPQERLTDEDIAIVYVKHKPIKLKRLWG